MKKELRILLVEDNIEDVGLIAWELKRSKMTFDMRSVHTRESFTRQLDDFAPDVVLSDHSLPSFSSMEAFNTLKEKNVDVPFILVTGSVSEEFAVECMKAGVDDYILKSSLKRLPPAIQSLLATRELKREKQQIEVLHKKLKHAYREIAEKNKSITDSIEYAKRIQEAMLPEKAQLLSYYPESFILHKPKDIVSGDFYWVSEHDGKYFIVVSDCTGHGVPGALMSMIGVSLLRYIIGIKGTTAPGEILRKMNKGIHRVLKQEDETPNWDGMDISICCIDKRTNVMTFAGANSSLYYIRNKMLNIIHGASYGVGGSHLQLEMEYESHEISMKPGDTIYLATDGYADQFGGEKGKKMMRKNFLTLVNDIQRCSMEEQGNRLEKYFLDWKGSMEQTDDVLVLGIRF